MGGVVYTPFGPAWRRGPSGARPVAFTGDADMWCRTCAVERYGPEVEDFDAEVRDREGNDVLAVYSWELDAGDDAYCGGCLESLP